MFDAIAIRVAGPKAWDERLSIGVELTDMGESHRLDLRNGVLVHRAAPVDGANLVLRLPRAALVRLGMARGGRTAQTASRSRSSR